MDEVKDDAESGRLVISEVIVCYQFRYAKLKSPIEVFSKSKDSDARLAFII